VQWKKEETSPERTGGLLTILGPTGFLNGLESQVIGHSDLGVAQTWTIFILQPQK